MDAETRRIVLASSGQVFAAKGRFAEAFYQRLFEFLPEAQSLFRRDLHHQKRMLMAALAMVVGILGNRASLAQTALHLRRVHSARGVSRASFQAGRQAFDFALQDFFGEECSGQIREAWLAAFDDLLDMMYPDKDFDAAAMSPDEAHGDDARPV